MKFWLCSVPKFHFGTPLNCQSENEGRPQGYLLTTEDLSMKSFSQWTIEEVEDIFHVVSAQENKLLADWLDVSSDLSREQEKQLDRLCKKLRSRVWDWNEEELKVGFIGLLLDMVDFDQEDYRSFMEREISAVYEDEKLSGTVDFLVAQGRRSPRHPFFFIHEYKKEHDSSNDPLGQLMIAMIAAQIINNNNNPVYGAYVMGRHWYFVVLDSLEYAVSLGHNAAKHEELKDIFGILKNTREIIDNLINKSSAAFTSPEQKEG
ncbi:MAG: hypothetical protein GY795_10550 [Desulfobacterales bacterium]|nr:hypothetical protein [Desulfobacterales bacterium]